MEDLINVLIPKSANPNLALPDPELLTVYRGVENRVIWILDEIDATAFDWAELIIEYNRQDALIEPNHRKPIRLMIASPGGSLECANMLIDVISMSLTPVYAVAMGMCASAASMIYLACHKRYALSSASFLFHKGSCSGIDGTFDQVQNFMEQYRKEVEKLVVFYKSHTNYDPEVIEDKLNHGDWYIDLKEALDKNVVNSIATDIEILI